MLGVGVFKCFFLVSFENFELFLLLRMIHTCFESAFWKQEEVEEKPKRSKLEPAQRQALVFTFFLFLIFGKLNSALIFCFLLCLIFFLSHFSIETQPKMMAELCIFEIDLKRLMASNKKRLKTRTAEIFYNKNLFMERINNNRRK